MATTTTDLLAQVIANFDDVATRAVYADALAEIDEPRAELVALGCELADVPTVQALVVSPLAGDALARRAAQHRRSRQLLAAHGERWRVAAGQTPQSALGRFVGGFVEDADVLAYDEGELAVVARLLACEPIRDLRLRLHAGGFAHAHELPLQHIRRLRLETSDSEIGPLLENCVALESLSFEDRVPIGRLRALPPMPSLVALELHDPTIEGLDLLAEHPIAGQLRRLSITRAVYNQPADGSSILPLDGRFPNLESLRAVDFTLSDNDFIAMRLRLRVPRTLELGSATNLGARGFAAIAASSTIRSLCTIRLGQLDAESLAVLLGVAESLETIELARGLDEPSGVQLAGARQALRSLVLPKSRMSPRTVAGIVGAHDLHTLSVSGVTRAIVNQPRARSIRDLDVSDIPITDEVASAIATSPNLVGLRRLNLGSTAISNIGLEAIAASPHLRDLVALDVVHSNIRISPAILAMPSLVAVRRSELGTSEARAAALAHFGAIDGYTRSLDISIFFADPFSPIALDQTIRDGGYRHERGNGGALVVFLDGATIHVGIVRRQGTYLSKAAAYLAPSDRAAAIAGMTSRIDLDIRNRPADATRLLALAAYLARACNGVVWDRFEDMLDVAP